MLALPETEAAIGSGTAAFRGCSVTVSLLQWVYDRFGDGFETADLKAARAYLDCWK